MYRTSHILSSMSPSGAITIGTVKAMLESNDVEGKAYIVRAVTTHDELIALLRFLVSLDDDDIDNLDSIKARAKEIIAEEKGIAC